MTEKELMDVGYRKYTGNTVDVYFNRDMCIHSGICVTNLPEVFDTSRRLWILPDNADDKRLMEVIDRCPSKALKYIVKE